MRWVSVLLTQTGDDLACVVQGSGPRTVSHSHRDKQRGPVADDRGHSGAD